MVFSKKNLKKWATILLILMPILNTYESIFNKIGWGELLMLPILIGCIFYSNDILLSKFKHFYFFYFYSIIISMVMLFFVGYLSSSDIIFRLIRDLYYFFLVIFVGYNFFYTQYGIILYKKVVLFACGIEYFQTLIYYLTNKALIGVIPNLSLNYTIRDYNEYVQTLKESFNVLEYRPSSIFLEPESFILYCIPLLIIILFSTSSYSRKKIVLSLFVSGAILLSTSLTGYILLLFIWIIWIIIGIKKGIRKNNIIFFLILIIIIPVTLVYLNEKNNFFLGVMDRLNTLGNNNTNSVNVRLLKGFTSYSSLIPIHQLFGLGFGAFDSYNKLNNIAFQYDNGTEFMNSISNFLISTGAVGTVLYIISLFKMMNKNSTSITKILILLLVILFFSSSIYSTPVYLLILTLALNFNNKEKRI